MKRSTLFGTFVLALSLVIAAHSAHAQESWKGEPDVSEWNFGLLTGLGLIDPSAGFGLIGNVAKKIAHEGFIPDINDQAFIEVGMGPVWAGGGTAFSYSAHLRWDFGLNPDWTIYALGGLGGNVRGKNQGSGWIMYPRFGAGVMLHFAGAVAARAEVSHEYTMVGLVFSM
jgi:hypothetical protein